MCRACARQTSVTAGTIFHRTRTPLSTWFAAIWFVTSQKNGVSAQGLQRVLGFGSYETAWAWMHKLRRAMVRPDRDLLSGIVEVDETFVGGVSSGRLGASSDKMPVMVAVEKVNGAGRNWAGSGSRSADRPGSLELVEFAQRVVEPGSTVRTDGARMMRRLGDRGLHPRVHRRLQRRRPDRGAARRPPDRLAAQTLADRDPALRRRRAPPALLPRRVHLPLQPPQRHAAAACCSTDSSNKPSNTDPHPLHTLLQPETNPYFT